MVFVGRIFCVCQLCAFLNTDLLEYFGRDAQDEGNGERHTKIITGSDNCCNHSKHNERIGLTEVLDHSELSAM